MKLKDTWRVSRKVFGLIWQASPRYTTYIIILLLASSITPILEAYFIKRIIDQLMLSVQQEVAFQSVVVFLLLFIGATIVNRLIENQRQSTTIILGSLFNKHILQRIVEKTTKLPFRFFEDASFQDRLDRVRTEATYKPLNAFYHFFGAIQSTLMLISVSVVIFTLSPIFVVLLVVFTIPGLFVQVRYGKVWWSLIHRDTPKSRRAHYYSHLLTNSTEMKDIKLLNLKEHLLGKYRQLYDELFNDQKKVVMQRFLWQIITYLISDIVLVLYYFYLAWQTFLQALTIGDFTFYASMYSQGIQALHGLVRDLAGIYENNLFVNDILEFLELEEEPDQGIPVSDVTKGFTFEDVWFRYPGTKNWILKGVSFTLPLSGIVALVGENGAGKTTIVKLLTRLYRPTKGKILLDGRDIQDLKLDAYRGLFGIVFQDFAHFHFTVKDNITFGDIDRDISDREVVELAKKAQIHKKIISLPNKYKTLLGRWFQQGHQISYGEWQRVAIARLLAKHAPVYILDEPTAALDAKAEYLIYKEFQGHVKGKTTLFISHRFANVKLAHQILVLKEGKIIQQGSHRELMEQKGTYKELYTFQARRYRE